MSDDNSSQKDQPDLSIPNILRTPNASQFYEKQEMFELTSNCNLSCQNLAFEEDDFIFGKL